MAETFYRTIILSAMQERPGIDELYDRAKAGDKTARNRLYERLLESFRTIIRHRIWVEEDAEDIVQDALTAVIDKYGEVVIESSFAAWAHRVLKNKIVDYYRQKKTQAGRITELEQEQTPNPYGEPDPLLRTSIENCFAKIHKSHRQHARILSLHFQGFATEEICARLGITRANCYVILSRARAMLEKCLNQEEDVS